MIFAENRMTANQIFDFQYKFRNIKELYLGEVTFPCQTRGFISFPDTRYHHKSFTHTHTPSTFPPSGKRNKRHSATPSWWQDRLFPVATSCESCHWYTPSQRIHRYHSHMPAMTCQHEMFMSQFPIRHLCKKRCESQRNQRFDWDLLPAFVCLQF